MRAVNPNNGQIPEESNEENDVSPDDSNSNENDDKKNGTHQIDLNDYQKQGLDYESLLESKKNQTHHYLKDLKDKQKKNELRLQQNQK